MSKSLYRLAVDVPLAAGASVAFGDKQAHYLAQVLRLKGGDRLRLFARGAGEWEAVVTEIRKREVMVTVERQTRVPAAETGLVVCFAPIKGGRLETILEKATELGASVIQPVITHRTIVDKVNLERAEAIAREAAEQCERVDWPEIAKPVKLAKLLGEWPEDVPLIYGDESGASASIALIEGGLAPYAPRGADPRPAGSPWEATQDNRAGRRWAILVGPEGGFTPEEFLALSRVKAARGVGLGPRILRADTAVIALCTLTLAAWGDWDERPRFEGGSAV